MYQHAHAVILYCSGFPAHRTHRELVRCARERGWLINAVGPPKNDGSWYTGGFKFDGVISHLAPYNTRLILPYVGDSPHVTTHAKTTEELNLPSAVLDHHAAGIKVGQHFVKYGFSNIAAVGLGSTFESRYEGLSTYMQKAALPPPTKLNVPLASLESDAQIVQALVAALKDMPLPLAIMASSDRSAVLLMQACWHSGLSIPAQVAICGFDNDPISCDLAPIPLTSVDTDFETQARNAVDLMDELLTHRETAPRRVTIPPKGVVLRRSTGIRATRDSTTARGCAYIHEHAMDARISIPDIAKAVGVSRATLFAAFRRELSTTPLAYLTELRIEKALELIETTGHPINDIRPQCGFASDYQMYKAFKRIKGKSPGSFR